MPPKGKKGGKQQHFDAEAAYAMLQQALAADDGAGPGKAKKVVPTKAGQTKAQMQQDAKAQMEAMYNAYIQQQQMAMQPRPLPKYNNKFMPMSAKDKEWFESTTGKWCRYDQFDPKSTCMQKIIDLMTENLTEPYNIFTYEHFIAEFPDLCICVYGVESKDKPSKEEKGTMVGCVSSKVSMKAASIHRGYIAMLAVDKSFRGARLGTKLVTETIKLMKKKGCHSAVLETPTHNERALKLYTSLGFIKTKYLGKYYMDRSDAVRLVLPLVSSNAPAIPENIKAAVKAAKIDGNGEDVKVDETD